MLEEIHIFVYDPSTADTQTYQIESYALKKALSRKITEIYMGSGIFTEFTRQSPETIIKKSKAFRQTNYMKDAELSGSESSM